MKSRPAIRVTIGAGCVGCSGRSGRRGEGCQAPATGQLRQSHSLGRVHLLAGEDALGARQSGGRAQRLEQVSAPPTTCSRKPMSRPRIAVASAGSAP